MFTYFYINAGLLKGHCRLETFFMMTTLSVMQILLSETLKIMKNPYLKSTLKMIHLIQGQISFIMDINTDFSMLET